MLAYRLQQSEKNSLENKQTGKNKLWFGLAGFSFDASLEPKVRAQKRGRLAEAALARHALRDKAEHPENSNPHPRTTYAVECRPFTSDTIVADRKVL
jgi:hypothetical protein